MLTKSEIAQTDRHFTSSRFKTYMIAWSVFFAIAVLAGVFNGGFVHRQVASVSAISQAE
jgi:hypothetical protein